jgi:flavin reductase (DIM6/NTAB) family NADH-FMN oxidoreductase RutF
MTSDAFETLMDSVDPPLIVLTTAAENTWAGCLVGFHGQSSLSPQQYCIWLSKANHTYRASLRAGHFVVHFLGRDDLTLAERFGTQCGEDGDKFTGLDIDLDPQGLPVLRACPNRMSLERIAMIDDGGDHVCLTTRVISAESAGPFVPLRVSAATHLDPGHPGQERAVHP